MQIGAFFLVASSLVVLAFSQAPCCAPNQWTAYFKSFENNGKTELDAMVMDVINDRLFLSYTTAEFQTGVWFMPGKGVSYLYDFNNEKCYQYNDTQNVQNLCVGGDNDTYLTTVVLGSTLNNAVWSRPDPDNHAHDYIVVSSAGCIPVAFEYDRDPDSQFNFHDFDFVYNVTNSAIIPPLPPACNSGEPQDVPIAKRSEVLNSFNHPLLRSVLRRRVVEF